MFLSMIETQLGILPTAEFDGKVLSGNATIARYLAEEYGKYHTCSAAVITKIAKLIIYDQQSIVQSQCAYYVLSET